MSSSFGHAVAITTDHVVACEHFREGTINERDLLDKEAVDDRIAIMKSKLLFAESAQFGVSF